MLHLRAVSGSLQGRHVYLCRPFCVMFCKPKAKLTSLQEHGIGDYVHGNSERLHEQLSNST